MDGSWTHWNLRGLLVALGAAVALTTAWLALSASSALAAAPPPHTDVMFVFDTSGSMGGELQEAKEKIVEVIEKAKATLPDAQFGVSQVEDVPGWEPGEVDGTDRSQRIRRKIHASGPKKNMKKTPKRPGISSSR